MQLNGRGNQGIALILALMTMIVVAGIATLLFARTVNEMKHSRDDAGVVQTLLLARGGANLGGAVLTGTVRDELNAIVNVRSSTTNCWSFGDGGCDDGQPTNSSVISALTGTNSVASQLQGEIDDLLCDASVVPNGTQATVTVRVYVTSTACGEALPGNIKLPSGRFVGGDPRPANQDYAIPFVMVSEAQQAGYKRNVVLQGEYRFTVGRVTFAQYALFTNHHTSDGGSDIWFTENTLFDGPVHTNEHFRFYANPWFGHKVTSAGCMDIETRTNPATGNEEEYCKTAKDGAYFHDNADRLRRNLGPNPSFGGHEPELVGGVDWRAEFVPLPTNAYEQSQVAQDNGLYFDGDLDSLKMWAADANGDALASDGKGGWKGPAVYQYIQGYTEDSDWVCTKWGRWSCNNWEYVSVETTMTYRLDDTGLLQVLDETTSPATWVTARTDFNGVIYVDGKVDRLTGPDRSDSSKASSAAPTIASFAQITLASADRIRITGDLKYESPPCAGAPTRNKNGTVTPATCDNLDSKNVLGIYVQDDDILIGNHNGDSDLNAPTDVVIHGVLMSSSGIVGVEDYDHGWARGSVNLLGGIIENNYGAFGTFNPSNGDMSTGYSRKFTYDRRMYSSVAPPYFPTIGLDKVKDVRVFSFGQREQVY